MKSTRFLWMLMVVLLVPAMALSGCDKKKHVNRDDDEDDSSSGSKEKSEQVEKEKKGDKDEILDNLIGEYKLNREGSSMMLGEEIPTDDGVGFELKGKAYLEKDNKIISQIYIAVSAYNNDYHTEVEMSYMVELRGSWTYDKRQRLLDVAISVGKVKDFDMVFDEYNDVVNTAIEEAGGIEKFKESLRNYLEVNVIKPVMQLKITELTKDGFFARDVKGRFTKVHFERVE